MGLAKQIKEQLFASFSDYPEWRIEDDDNEWLLEPKGKTSVVAVTYVDGKRITRTFKITVEEI